ncbi:hypothetical protein WME99_47765 [Sorangium sp. So ce136]|uniref:hypothetical protein n=1 Tax=Sorangium sp. So ce136 TaxID=3133284 RepID=UPI003F04E02F
MRQHDGKTDVLDGPCADTQAQFAGYFFVEAPSLDGGVGLRTADEKNKRLLVR